MHEERVTYFAYTDSRNKRVPFGIKAKDRTRHVYVIGKTGMGKSTLLENMAVQDIKNGEGLAFIDPHGKTAELLLDYVPEHRLKDVVYFAPFDTDHPISFNVLESVDADKRHLVVSGLMSTFKKIWQDAWSARMEYILTNTLLALLEYPGATLLGVNRMLSDKDFRKAVVNNVTDPSVKSFWVDEFAKYTERMAAEAVPAIQNKIGQFTANALIRNMIGQPTSSFNIREIMDQGKIMIINLSKGRIGESNANLLGGMLITKIYLGAMSRADVPDRVLKGLPNFYLFVDEFQNFANESFADILSEARKYKLNLTIAHQYIEQMEEEVRAAVFGNVGTMISFRVGAFDAEVLEKEFAPQFTAEDIVNLGFAQIYLKLMIDGISSPPFSAITMEPIKLPEVSLRDKVIAESRAQFARTRASVEEAIVEWHRPVMSAPAPSAGSGSGMSSGSKAPHSGHGSTGHAPAPVHHKAPAGTPAAALEIPTGRRMSGPDDPKTVKEMLKVMEAEKPVRREAPRHETPRMGTEPRKAPLLAPDEDTSGGFTSLSSLTPRPAAKEKPAAPTQSHQPHANHAAQPHAQTAQQPKTQNTQKVATPKNMGDLKSALAQLVKIPPTPTSSSASVPTPTAAAPAPHTPKPAHDKPHHQSHARHNSQADHHTNHTTTKEVPKDVLTNLLKVDHNSETSS